MNDTSNSIIENLPKSKQNFLTNKRLDSIFKTFQNCEQKWLKNDISLTNSKVFFHKQLKNESIKQMDSFDNSIRDKIENNSFFEQKFELQIQSNKYNVDFFHPKGKMSKIQIQDFFSDCCMKIYIWLSYIQPFIRTNCSKIMDIYIWFTNEKKQLIQNEKTFSSKHANSAFTTSCKAETTIYIYRKEEWFKVFIHETFHSLGLDFSHIMNDKYEQQIISLFPVKSIQGIRLYESYCEVWAELYHTLFIAFFQSTNLIDFKTMSKSLFFNELQFSAFQVVKILKHYDSSLEYDSFIKHKTPVIVESTSVLSYYIIKFVLLFYCREFETWCSKYNGTLFLQFQSKNIPLFYQFIHSKYNSSVILNYLREIGLEYDKLKLKLKLNIELKRTMRMTLNEI